MWKKVVLGALGLVLLGLGTLVVLATQEPDTFEIKRSVRIAAPPERVFALVDDFNAWGAWSPWDKLDPAMKRTHKGSPRGVGAIYEWEGNDDVGSGRMEIKRADAPRVIDIDLHFLKPFEAKNTTHFYFEAVSPGTEVTWTMRGENQFMSKLMSVVMDMDAMVGADFEKGLQSMKTAAE